MQQVRNNLAFSNDGPEMCLFDIDNAAVDAKDAF